IVIALIAFVAIWLIRKFMNRRRPAEPAYQTGGANLNTNLSQMGGYNPQEPRYTAPPTGQYLAPEANALSTPQIDTPPAIPAGFDS
ncbi:hypothetical protein SB786_36920, partial [Burkholderia sp. SIMBA_062]